MARGRLGFLQGEKKEGRRSKQVEEALLNLQGGQGSEEAAVEGMATRRQAAPVFPVRRDDRWGPSVRVLTFSIFPEIPGGFR